MKKCSARLLLLHLQEPLLARISIFIFKRNAAIRIFLDKCLHILTTIPNTSELGTSIKLRILCGIGSSRDKRNLFCAYAIYIFWEDKCRLTQRMEHRFKQGVETLCERLSWNPEECKATVSAWISESWKSSGGHHQPTYLMLCTWALCTNVDQ